MHDTFLAAWNLTFKPTQVLPVARMLGLAGIFEDGTKPWSFDPGGTGVILRGQRNWEHREESCAVEFRLERHLSADL